MNKKVFMVGVGGIGVSSLAKYLHGEGYDIWGSDNKKNENVENLEKNFDLKFKQGHDQKSITKDFDFLVYSPAVTGENPERVMAEYLGVKQYSYPEFLGKISEEKYTISITGTNGKTTTTTMIAELLDFFEQDVSVVMGGISNKFNSNFLPGNSEKFVVESCEFKNSFLKIFPNVIAITNITPDHLDFFGSFDQYKNSFLNFLENFKKTGGENILICNTEDQNLREVIKKARLKNIKIVGYQDYKVEQVTIPGEYNRENARVALAVLDLFGLDLKKAKEYLRENFVGPRRRFNFIGNTKDGAEVLDDYAHNPEGLSVLKQGLDEKFPGKKKVLVFQPHLFSRTEDFFEGFVKEISSYDTVYLLPICKAREEAKDFSITSEILFKKIKEKKSNTFFCENLQNCVGKLKEKRYGKDFVLITAGAGDVFEIGKKIVK